MTSKDFIQAEAENTDRIILYREGLFWTAYERSAYAVRTPIRPFKSTQCSLKTPGSENLSSIGEVAMSSDAEAFAWVRYLKTASNCLVLLVRHPIFNAEFEIRKSSVPLAPLYAGNGYSRFWRLFESLRGQKKQFLRWRSGMAGAECSYRIPSGIVDAQKNPNWTYAVISWALTSRAL